MKHIFVINPRAGKVDRVAEISALLKKFNGIIDYEIYATKSQGDAREYVNNYLKEHPENETYRFYACGGDGTLHDVANGAYKYSNAEVAVYASGSGNDFIKNFGDSNGFRDLESLIYGKPQKVDLLRVDDKVCVNIVSFGFDGEVTFAMHRFKRWPFISGKMAYNLGAVSSLLFKMSAPMKITIDDEPFFDGKGLLIAVANGHTYGGGFRCAPKALVNDGILDICFAKKISRFRAGGLMSSYKKGEHLTNPKCKDIIAYRKAKRVKIESNRDVAYQIDGETFRKNGLEIEVLPCAMTFIIPREC